ncbi:serine hydrolase domain-containing protein [Tunturiibacter gelidoferens]|uniref:CubicO group peptidase (Beta-lactamase class C family) n=1 Tax=Tunturiibacter gelidiferens TaxID=3069689 RepID=A0ACC5NTU3_9BACT|nr:serine hydrolase domain-containing protein [Edaphobacter lichenicola]MBB5337965.1 CubicO group peptidase (beta-lactamase class C family) [Edaphobacter lichenicola]
MRNLRVRAAAVFGFGFVTMGAGWAQNSLPAATATGIDAAAAEVMEATGVPSASVAVVQGGKISFVKAYGKARLEPVMLAEPGMQYSIGSVSKQFTAAIILLLVQDGKVKLDDPVGKYLPELTRAKDVTVRQVLSMTSGYQDFWPEDYVMTSMMQPATPQHILDVWGKKPLDFEPGTKWQYSNTNYVIAGRIAEIVAGKPLIEQLQERIFKPLKMNGVLNSDASRLPANDPTGYYQHALGPLRPAPQEGAGWMFAAGELAMPASDMALWNISLMNRTLLAPASYDEMFTEVKLKDGSSTHYGLGVQVGERDGHRIVSHSGEVSGFVSQNTVFPDDKAAVTVLTNEDASSAAAALARKIAPLVLGQSASANAADSAAGAEKRALDIFTGLQDGKLDRSQLTAFCDAYFTAEAVQDFASSLKPLGVPSSFKQADEELRGGMTFRVFDVSFPDRKLRVTTYEEPDGKLEQYLVIPSGS